MIELINRSRINLNLANASVKYVGEWMKSVDRFALYNPALKRVWRKMRSLIPSGLTKSRPIFQIKGRNFEIPGCGGFLMTDYADDLDEYYAPGKEIVCFSDHKNLIEKVKYYLKHDAEREEIAKAGYSRTLKDHTYEHRFNQLFSKIGLIDIKLSPQQRSGITEEIT